VVEKEKKKEIPELPPGYDALAIVNDWYKFRPEEKREITYPWKDGEEPEWLNKMLEDQDEPRSTPVDELDMEKHGLKYTWRKIRENSIKEDNEIRGKRRWNLVPSLKSKKRLRKKPFNSMQ